MLEYAKLHLTAALESVAALHEDHPPVSNASTDKHQSWLMGVTLMWFDFEYGDLICWLGDEYTNAFHDWEEVFQTVDTVQHQKVPPGYLPMDFDQAYHACTEGVPLMGIFECSMASTWKREQYDNHPPLAEERDVIREKLREEQNSFYLLLLHFLCYFIFGLHLLPLTFVWCKGKGRACVNNNSIIGPGDDGAPIDSIPTQGLKMSVRQCITPLP
jgi:hypothetical protein